MKQRLPQELIEDYKNNVPITQLCCKYELTDGTVRNQLMAMGLRKIPAWGGHREGGGRKKKETGGELCKIREKNKKIEFVKQSKGTKANPKFNLWKPNNDFGGGF